MLEDIIENAAGKKFKNEGKKGDIRTRFNKSLEAFQEPINEFHEEGYKIEIKTLYYFECLKKLEVNANELTPDEYKKFLENSTKKNLKKARNKPSLMKNYINDFLEDKIIKKYLKKLELKKEDILETNQFINEDKDLKDIIKYALAIENNKIVKSRIEDFIKGNFSPEHQLEYSLKRDDYEIILNNKNLLIQLRSLEHVSSCYHIFYGQHRSEAINYFQYDDVNYIVIKKKGKIVGRVATVVDGNKIGFIGNIYKKTNIKDELKPLILEFIESNYFNVVEPPNKIYIPNNIKSDAGTSNKNKITPLSVKKIEELIEY